MPSPGLTPVNASVGLNSGLMISNNFWLKVIALKFEWGGGGVNCWSQVNFVLGLSLMSTDVDGHVLYLRMV